ncbi:excalibur calcium-binding domain-containing protein [Aggregatibacter segnis]|nr:excalibur calcium-binding domain-containing protein [Aggregatibacter segnis]QQB09754.1 excalibur calcium-binding domain-containing protein [Aggregatibacter segnis]
MRSCAEAKYHFNVCGEGRLDRDNDGIPCENVCRR